MDTLFKIEVLPTDIPAIEGLTYLPDFIDTGEEAQLITAINAAPWDTSWDRRRQPYGAAYGPAKEQAQPIPKWGLSLAEKIRAAINLDRAFDQMLINEYLPGQGIALHRDYEPFDRTVASLSLLAPCVMDFCGVSGGRRESLLLEPRSLLILSDTARYDWQHGIARRKSDRWHGLKIPRERRLSVTFRTRKK